MPNVPRELEAICMKCLKKEPRDRYPSAAELADHLTAFLNGESLHGLKRRWLVFASVLNDGTSTSPPVLPDETASASLLASADTVMLFATWIVRLLLPMSAVTVGVVSASAVALVTLTAAPPRLRTLA